MSLACGRTRSTVVANGGAAAVARAAGFESAMTQQWYTNAATETSRPMKIRALGHVSLFVRDLEATRRFYRDLLGLAETGSGKDGHVAFEVGETSDELAAARRDVVSRGLEPFGEYANGFCVRDPDGHEVELYVEPARRHPSAVSERR
ncbi:MAG: hypothetical protein DME13_20755 [Candidatus Rokuibacteriota bacterium]|nr:MAG: hypothetical protein DME13_20755 [Candidatus Rokubacteria bacterium]